MKSKYIFVQKIEIFISQDFKIKLVKIFDYLFTLKFIFKRMLENRIEINTSIFYLTEENFLIIIYKTLSFSKVFFFHITRKKQDVLKSLKEFEGKKVLVWLE